MDFDEKTKEKIQELQGLEQTMHQLIMQKQAFQMELTETENALTEIKKSNDDVFKMVGSIMIKADKKTIEKELTKKQELMSLRFKSIESQEDELSKSAEKLRAEVMKKMK